MSSRMIARPSGMLTLVSDRLVRVLIVDDQEPFRAAARQVVGMTAEFEVVGEAGTGEQSVELAAELSPDLVLMDFKLPGIDGLEATRRILNLGLRNVVVLVLSTYETGELGDQALDAGAAAFMSKSDFGPDELAEAWAAARP